MAAQAQFLWRCACDQYWCAHRICQVKNQIGCRRKLAIANLCQLTSALWYGLGSGRQVVSWFL